MQQSQKNWGNCPSSSSTLSSSSSSSHSFTSSSCFNTDVSFPSELQSSSVVFVSAKALISMWTIQQFEECVWPISGVRWVLISKDANMRLSHHTLPVPFPFITIPSSSPFLCSAGFWLIMYCTLQVSLLLLVQHLRLPCASALTWCLLIVLFFFSSLMVLPALRISWRKPSCATKPRIVFSSLVKEKNPFEFSSFTVSVYIVYL